MHKLRIFPIIATSLLLSCISLFMVGCTNEDVAFNNFAESLEERRESDWSIPDNVDNLVGVYTYSLVSEEVQKMGLSAITDISDCDVVMEFYENGNGRIALYGERSKGPHPTSEAYDLEWYAEKIETEGLNMDAYQDFADFYMVQVAFYKHFDIGFEGEYIFMRSVNDPYVYKYGSAQYDNAEDWSIVRINDPDENKILIISTIKLK